MKPKRHAGHTSKEFEVGDRTYEVHSDYFFPGSPGSYEEPPDGSEWSAKNIVDVIFESGREDWVTYETFLREYAAHHKLTEEQAQDDIDGVMIQSEFDWLERAYDCD